MEKLSEADLREILTAIEILGQDVEAATLPQRVVDAIATVVDVDFISYNEVDPANGTSRFLLKPDIAEMPASDPAYAAFVRRFGHHPVVAQHVSRNAPTGSGLMAFVSRLRLLGMVGNCCGEAELRLRFDLNVASTTSRLVGSPSTAACASSTTATRPAWRPCGRTSRSPTDTRGAFRNKRPRLLIVAGWR